MNIQSIFDHFSKISKLESIHAVLAWDTEVTLPEGAITMRHQQIEVLLSQVHALATDADFLNAVIALPDQSDHFPAHQIHNLKRKVLRKATVDSELQKNIISAELKALEKWRLAKEQSNFSLIAEDLQELVNLRRKAAQQLQTSSYFPELKNKSLYDIMIDGSEPGLTNQDLQNIFYPLKEGLMLALKKKATAAPLPTDLKAIDFSVPDLLQKFGFDLKKGRIDTTTSYPFCSGGQDDVRITTRAGDDFFDNLLTTLHEMGHGLYEQNLPADLQFTPSGVAASTGFHESQSRFYENQIGRSEGFIRYLSGKINLSADTIRANLRARTQTPVRSYSDEVAYNLHVILRWEIEQALVDGSLKVQDIPEVWNRKMKEYLNIEIKNDQEGCLQDLHWFASDFAWFPTYALGNVIAANLYAKFKQEHPDADARIAAGDFIFIKEFLNRLHSQSAQKDFKSLTKYLFGNENLSAHAVLQYLNERY